MIEDVRRNYVEAALRRSIGPTLLEVGGSSAGAPKGLGRRRPRAGCRLQPYMSAPTRCAVERFHPTVPWLSTDLFDLSRPVNKGGPLPLFRPAPDRRRQVSPVWKRARARRQLRARLYRPAQPGADQSAIGRSRQSPPPAPTPRRARTSPRRALCAVGREQRHAHGVDRRMGGEGRRRMAPSSAMTAGSNARASVPDIRVVSTGYS